MPKSVKKTGLVTWPASPRLIKSIKRSHPHRALIHKLLELPREDVHSIAHVVMAIWAFEDEAKKIAKKRLARGHRTFGTRQ